MHGGYCSSYSLCQLGSAFSYMHCRLPPTKVYGAVPPPQQLAGGSTTGVTTESSSSIKIEPESRSATEQIPIPVSSPTAPAFAANTPLLHLPIPCSITEGNILVSNIYPVPFYEVQLANRALQHAIRPTKLNLTTQNVSSMM